MMKRRQPRSGGRAFEGEKHNELERQILFSGNILADLCLLFVLLHSSHTALFTSIVYLNMSVPLPATLFSHSLCSSSLGLQGSG